MQSPTVWELRCSVCKTVFDTTKDWLWLKHLLEPLHQNLARLECVDWDQKMRECILVVYCSFPVPPASVLQFFTKMETSTIVTDFVWNENRPLVMILPFESRNKVDEIMNGLGGPDFQINNQLFQLKKGVDYLTMEWDQFIQDFGPDSSMVEAVGTPRKKKIGSSIGSYKLIRKMKSKRRQSRLATADEGHDMISVSLEGATKEQLDLDVKEFREIKEKKGRNNRRNRKKKEKLREINKEKNKGRNQV